MNKVHSQPPHVHSKNSSRRSWFRSMTAAAILPAIASATSSAVSQAIASHVEATEALRRDAIRHERVLVIWGESSSGTPGYRKVIRSEAQFGDSMARVCQAEEAVIASMDDASIRAIVSGPELYVIADLEDCGRRRLVVLPTSAIVSSVR